MRLRLFHLVVFCLVTPVSANAETETLEQTWAQVYQNNPSLQASRAELRSTDEKVSQALSHWRPTIDGNASIGKNYQYIPDEATFGSANYAATSRSYGVQVTQPLFRGFRTSAEVKSADKEILAGRAKLDDVEQQLFLDTGTTFLDVLRDQDIVEYQRSNEVVLQKKLFETQERFKGGELTQTDVHQAETRLARAKVSRLQAENSLEQGRNSYMRLVGKSPENLQPPALDEGSSKDPEELMGLAETQNPKVVAAQYAIDSAKAFIEFNKGSLRPEVNLVGSSSRIWGQGSTMPGREDSSQIMVQMTRAKSEIINASFTRGVILRVSVNKGGSEDEFFGMVQRTYRLPRFRNGDVSAV